DWAGARGRPSVLTPLAVEPRSLAARMQPDAVWTPLPVIGLRDSDLTTAVIATVPAEAFWDRAGVGRIVGGFSRRRPGEDRPALNTGNRINPVTVFKIRIVGQSVVRIRCGYRPVTDRVAGNRPVTVAGNRLRIRCPRISNTLGCG